MCFLCQSYPIRTKVHEVKCLVLFIHVCIPRDWQSLLQSRNSICNEWMSEWMTFINFGSQTQVSWFVVCLSFSLFLHDIPATQSSLPSTLCHKMGTARILFFLYEGNCRYTRRRKWQPTPIFLPGESRGQRSLVGCCLWGRTESDTTEVT